MHKQRYLLAAAALMAVPAIISASEPADSVPEQNLKEVVVEGQNQRIAAKAVEYTPTSRQRNISATAVDLLRHMAIPELNIQPGSSEVKTLDNEEVTIFIDYVAVSDYDLTGMRTKDALRVEYYDYPTDPRFMGAKHVINFIMQQYEYGGYTKLYGSETAVAYNNGNYSAFSKLQYHRMTYDVYAGAGFFNSAKGHSGSEIEEHYRIPRVDGTSRDIDRYVSTLSDNSNDNLGVSFRARYVTDKVQIANSIFFSRSHSPYCSSEGHVWYSDASIAGGDYYSRNASQSISPSYSGMFYFTLPRSFALTISPTASYSHNKQWSESTEGDYYTNVNNVREDYWSARLPVQVNKRINEVHSILFGIDGLYTHNRVSYAGTYPSVQSLNFYFAAAKIGYSSQLGKFYTDIDGGISNEWNIINGHTTTHFYPFIHISESYLPNDKNKISLWMQYASNSPQTSDKSDNYLRSNEMLWITGNPDLGNSDHITTALQYTWMPSNRLQALLYTSYFCMLNNRIDTYLPYESGLVRKPQNSGTYSQFFVGANAAVYFLDRRLQIRAGVSARFDRSTALRSDYYSLVSGNISATYYINNFWVNAYFNSPTRGYNKKDGTIYKNDYFCQFSAGWGNSSWTVQARVYQPFTYNWHNGTQHLDTPYLTIDTTNINTGKHFNVSATVTYTFGYGKKVQHGDEIGSGGTGSSAIMH